MSLALQVFNEKTVAALRQDGFNDSAAFVNFILRMWKIMNNKSTTAYITLHDDDRKPITCSNDSRLTFLEDAAKCFSKMAPNKSTHMSSVPQQTRRVMALTKETSSSLVQTLNGLVDLCAGLLNDNAVRFVLLGRFQSDALEGEFGIYRGIFGGLYHITFEQLLICGKLRRLELLLDLEEIHHANPEIHHANCCVSEFSIEEWETLDTLFNDLHRLTECERQTIFYIAGYIHKKEHMTETNCVTDVNGSDDSEFLSLVSRGRLTFPSEELFNFSLLSYVFFKKFENRCKQRIVRIFSVLYECYFFEFLPKDKVISRLGNIFMKGLVRKWNDSLPAASNERKRIKLSNQ